MNNNKDNKIIKIKKKIKPEELFKELKDKYLNNGGTNTGLEIIRKTYNFARDAHKGFFRKSGDEYITHPLSATIELLNIKPDLPTIQACLLHDVPEETNVTLDSIKQEFGKEIFNLVEGIGNITGVRYKDGTGNIENLRKMLITVSNDVRTILIKLADRIHNMRTIEFLDNKKVKRFSEETLYVFAPLADRLGVYDFKYKLEELSFKTLYPKEYTKIKKDLNTLLRAKSTFLNNIEKDFGDILDIKNNKNFKISYRIKSPYSIFKKTRKKQYDRVEDIYDIFAIRVLTNSIQECYEVLGKIHYKYVPIQGRLKDYISLPKPNGYQSLHTTITGVINSKKEQPIEVQIRTYEMHNLAEYGVAAHFSYSESGKSVTSSNNYWVNTIQSMLKDVNYSEVSIDSIFKDRIYVLTPSSDVKELPAGSTPIDFAYSIHSDVGNHIAVARVNAKVVSLEHELHNGDRVEIITNPSRKPNLAWISIVKTGEARQKIKKYFLDENKDILIEKGKHILNRYLEDNYGISLDNKYSVLSHSESGTRNISEREDILARIGNLSQKPHTYLSSLYKDKQNKIRKISEVHKQNILDKEENTSSVLENNVIANNNKQSIKPELKQKSISPSLITIGGEKGIYTINAKCCNPSKGDKIVGYITRDSGIKIHKISCGNIRKASLDKIINANYEGVSKYEIIKIYIYFNKKPKSLYSLQSILNKNKLDLLSLSTSISNSNKRSYLVKIICYYTNNLFIKESLEYDLKLKYKEFEKIVKK